MAQHGGDVRSDVCKLAASYHSTRLVVAITRCAQSLLARRDTLTVLLFVANRLGGGLAAIWLTLLFLLLVDTPFSWRKFPSRNVL